MHQLYTVRFHFYMHIVTTSYRHPTIYRRVISKHALKVHITCAIFT